MKLKNKIFSLVSAIVGATIVISLPIINSNKTITHNNVLDSNQNSWITDGSNSNEETMQLEFKTKDELETDLKDFVPKKVDKFSNDDIKLFLKAKGSSSLGSNWYVQIENPSNDDIVNGKIRFKVFQNKRKSDGTYEKIEIKNNNEEFWDTSKSQDVSKYILSSKYKFSWASNEDLKSFFESTNVSAETLDKKTVLDNLISRDATLPNDSNIDVIISDIGSTFSKHNEKFSRENNGVKKVSISFKSSNDNDWENNKKPSNDELTRIFRGFKIGDSYNDMIMEVNTEFNLSNAKVQNDSLFKGLLSSGGNISDLTPSQFVSVVEEDLNNQTTFFNMITQGKGIGDKPLVDIKYMGVKITDSNFNSVTGLNSSDYSIKKIRTIPNDLDGSLQLIYTYEAIDIFTNQKIEKEFKQFFPASSFKTSLDSNKILDFSWKIDESLLPVGSSYDLVNLYKLNSTDNDYLKEISNEFFIGTKDSYNQNRNVSIEYASGTSQTNNGNGWEPLVSNETKVKIVLKFDSWNGATYKDNDGTIKKGFKAEKIFDLKSYKVGENANQISITWKSQNDFIQNNASFVYELPSNIVKKIEKKQGEIGSDVIRKNVFYNLNNDQNLSTNEVFIPNDLTGTIRIIIEVYQGSGNTLKQLGVFSNVYVGMKKNENSSSIVEFSWIPDVGINPELLSKPIKEVTKDDVIQYYLNEISLFENKSLTANDVELEIIPDANGVEYLKINVTIPMFDQDKNNVAIENKTFTTKITGFANVDFKNKANINPQSDLTALVSIPFAATTTCIFLVILNSMILRRSKIRTFKNKK